MKNKIINRILIIGGTGFIGKHLIEELKKKRFAIISPTKKKFNLKKKKINDSIS